MKTTKLSFDAFTNADFAICNKNNNVEEYDHEIKIGASRNEKVKITEVAELSNKEYDEFIHDLLSDRKWLAGKGGCDSTANVREVKSFFDFTEEEAELWRSESFRLCVAVQSKNKRTLYIDPQGYGYARYVGI